MTNGEATKVIQTMLAVTDLSVRGNLTADMVKACRMAIKALSEPTIPLSVIEDIKAEAQKEIRRILDTEKGSDCHVAKKISEAVAKIIDKAVKGEEK